MLRLVLVDDNPTFLQALDMVLCGFPDVRVVGRATDAPEGLRLIDSLDPDLVLTDLRMPYLDGIALTRKIREGQRRASVVVMSLHGGADYEAAAKSAGAMAFVSKADLLDELPALLNALDGKARQRLYTGEPQ
jgi:DNA-binding NarL/FixJ family response regulator